MGILLVFAFLSGLVTIFAPCIWPLLPIILSSSTTGGKKKPLGITLGIIVSFGIFTLTISYIVSLIPFDPTILRYIAVFVIGFLGLTLMVPKLTQILEGYVSKLSSSFRPVNTTGTGFTSGFITGISLGIVWTPCAGPILATIATLAATQAVNFQIVLVTVAYLIGVGIPLYFFSLLGQSVFSKSRFLSKYTGRIQQIFGVIMILTAVAIATNYDRTLQARLLDAFPSYSQFIINLETAEPVKKELDKLRNPDAEEQIDMPFPKASDTSLPVITKAPDFVGIENWLNSDSLTIESLRGKVVLIDFWTYTCINCIRTLPYVTSWYEKYKDKNFIVVGVHTPEFEFEKNTTNVANAIKQYNITYPVAQDNDYATWRAYDNHYWPAKYLIDKDGNIRYFHFGEGKYEETEKAIQMLIKQTGMTVDEKTTAEEDSFSAMPQTPETYLGYGRMERFEGQIKQGLNSYTFPKTLNRDSIAFSGIWDVQEEKSISTKQGSQLMLKFYASKVFLVITPKSSEDKIQVIIDRDADAVDFYNGKDVVDGYVKLDVPRLYELIDLKDESNEHELILEFENEGTEVYAFTFGG